MKCPELWRQSKYELHGSHVRASRNLTEVGPGSRLITDIVARFYSVAIPQFASGALLDLGCGKAPLYGLYSRYVQSVMLVDWPNTLHPNPHLDLIQDINDPLSMPSESFQTVIMSDVLEHVHSPASLIREVARVLVPRGILILNVPFLVGLHEQPHDYYRYTRFALERIITHAGFQILELRAIGGYLEVHADLLSKLLYRLPLIGPYAALALQYIAAAVVSTRVGAKLEARTREHFPLGYVMIASKRASGTSGSLSE